MTKSELAAIWAKYGGSAVAAYFGTFTAQEWAAVVGAMVAVCGFVMSWYYKHQHLKLARAKAKADPEA